MRRPYPWIVSPINKIEWLWDLCGGSKPSPYEVNLTVRMSLGTSRFVYVLNNKLFTSMDANEGVTHAI